MESSAKAALASINPTALRLIDALAQDPPALGVAVTALANDARRIDAGVVAPGSLEAARLFSEACLGGLGRVAIGPRPLGSGTVAEARVCVDHPLVACMASQYAGWKIQLGRFFAMGSGPARAVAATEPLFERYALKTRAERTVLLLETDRLPDSDVAELVASRCGLSPSAITLVAAATSSLVGSTQIAARSVETALHKLMELDFDLSCILAGTGACPIAPGTPDSLAAIGRTNDAILYGAEVALWVRTTDDVIEAVLSRTPSSTSRDYGRLCHDLFREYGDFYKIDPLLFSPARITFINAATGRVFTAGDTNEAILLRSFGISALS